MIKRETGSKKGKLNYHKNFNSTQVADFMVCKIFNINKKFSW